MAEAKSLKEKVLFIAAGIRLHIKEYFLRLTGLFGGYKYCISFPSVKEGLRAEKEIKGLRAVSIPVPNEIFEGCGVGVLVKEDDLEEVLKRLEDKGILVSGVFKREGDRFVEVKRS